MKLGRAAEPFSTRRYRRVLITDRSLPGYRWGVEREWALLQKEMMNV